MMRDEYQPLLLSTTQYLHCKKNYPHRPETRLMRLKANDYAGSKNCQFSRMSKKRVLTVLTFCQSWKWPDWGEGTFIIMFFIFYIMSCIPINLKKEKFSLSGRTELKVENFCP